MTTRLPDRPAGAVAPAPLRCAVHPARPAVDDCPVCGRPRCGADIGAAAAGGGCLGCRGRAAAAAADAGVPAAAGGPTGAKAAADRRSPVERLTAGAVVAFLLAQAGAVIASEYVGAAFFAELVPFLVGLMCAAGAAAAARTAGKGRFDVTVRVVGALAALLGTALSFRLVPGGQSPFTPLGTVGPPYLSALAGAAVSRLFR